MADGEQMTAVERGAELRRCLDLTGWSLNEAGKRMSIAPREAGDICRGNRDISEPWLNYFRTVARLVSSVKLPTGESDDPSDLPAAITADGLTLAQKEQATLGVLKPREAPVPSQMVQTLSPAQVVQALAEAFVECQEDMGPRELSGAQQALVMAADKLGVEAALLEHLRKMPAREVKVIPEAALADDAAVEVGGRSVWQPPVAA